MATIEQAIEALAEAERRLRDLVGQAAAVGEYDAVGQIAEAARTMGAIARTWRNGDLSARPVSGGTAAMNAAAQPGASIEPGEAPAPPAGPAGTRRRGRRPARQSKRAPARGEYPKFFRRGDQLIKIGWSRKGRREYEHKAPRPVVDALAAAISRRAGGGRLFTSDQVMPLKDPATAEELPGYQAYVALAWFKSAGLVKQHGRSGYSVKNGNGLAEAVRSSWQKLPETRVRG